MGLTRSFLAALFFTWPDSQLPHPRLRGGKLHPQQSPPVGQGRITTDSGLDVPFQSWWGWLVEERFGAWKVNQSAPGPSVNLLETPFRQIKEKILVELARVIDTAELQSQVLLNSISFADTCDTNMTIDWSQANVTNLTLDTVTNASLSGGWNQLTIAPSGQVSLQYQMGALVMVTIKNGATIGSTCNVFRKMQVPMLVGASWLREVSWNVNFSEPHVEQLMNGSRNFVYAADLAFEDKTSNYHIDSVKVVNRTGCTINVKVGVVIDVCNDFREIVEINGNLLMNSSPIQALWQELVKKLALEFHVPVSEVAMPLLLRPPGASGAGHDFSLAGLAVLALAAAAASCAVAKCRRRTRTRPQGGPPSETWD